MRAFVAVTDKDWYQFLAGRPDLDEVNFWQPGGNRKFQALSPSEPLLFTLHYPDNAIVGGWFFCSRITDRRETTSHSGSREQEQRATEIGSNFICDSL